MSADDGDVEVAADGPWIQLRAWRATPRGDDDPYAGLAADVELYGRVDPLATLRGLSEASGIPVGALARYVLARWATGGSEAHLELGTSGVDHLARAIDEAERTGSDAARLEAYAAIRELIAWLRAGDA